MATKFEATTPKTGLIEFLKCLLIGPGKHGKTTMALTMSIDWPDKDPAKGEPDVVLSDVLYLPFDNQGLDDFKLRRIVPRWSVEMLEHAEGPDIIKFLDQMAALVQEKISICASEGKKLIVIADTVSTMNAVLESHFEGLKGGSRTKWGKLLLYNKRLFNPIRSGKCHGILICHTKHKVAMDKDGEDKLNKEKTAQGLPGKFDIVADVIGQGGRFMKNNVSLILPLLADAEKNGMGKRWVYPQGSYGLGIEGGSRYSQLPQKMPADFRAIKKVLGIV